MQSTLTTVSEDTSETADVSILELGVSSDKITRQLKQSGQLVLTNNNNPVAIMLDVNDSTLEDTMRDLRFLRMRKAIKAIQDASVKSGLSNMTLDEINAEINAARDERRAGEKIR